MGPATRYTRRRKTAKTPIEYSEDFSYLIRSFWVQRIETILHLFCFCPVVDQFWNEVFSWICCHFKQGAKIFAILTKCLDFRSQKIVIRRI